MFKDRFSGLDGGAWDDACGTIPSSKPIRRKKRKVKAKKESKLSPARQLLLKTADYIEKHGWTRGELEYRGRVCWMGGMRMVDAKSIYGKHSQVGFDALALSAAYLREKTCCPSLPFFNDHVAKSRVHILKVIREVAFWNPSASL